MSLDAQSLASLFELSRDAVIGMQGGDILFANPTARKRYTLEAGGDTSPLAPFLSDDAGERYICSGTLNGHPVDAVVSRSGAFTLLTITERPAESTTLPLHDQTLQVMSRDLMSLRMSADLLLGGIDIDGSEKLRFYAATLYHSYYRIKRLHEHLKLANCLLSGAQPFEPRPLDPDALVARICDTAAPLVRERGISLLFRSGEGRRLLSGDAHLIEVLVLNLLANSFLHASSGDEIRVTLSSQGKQIVLAVDDPGSGIPAERMAELYSLRPEPSLTDTAAGEGLGLLLVRSIAELHGGSLLIESRENAGTHVRVVLPAVPSDNIVTMNQPGNTTPLSGMDVLLTELSPVLDNSIYTQKYFD